jgi:hypothetical protein
MKRLFVIFALLSATAAQAATVKIDTVDAVYTSPMGTSGNDVRLEGFKFEVKPELGRARIDILYTSDYVGGGDDGGYGPGENDVLVSGLAFDTSSSQVIFTNAARKVTACANVTITQGFLGRKIKIKNTGLCTLSTTIEDIATDDGWEIKHRKVLNVFLNVQD